MSEPPEKAPPGQRPELPPPSDAALHRAKPLFDRLVGELRGAGETPLPLPAAGTAPPRQYPVARQLLPSLATAAAPPPAAAAPAEPPLAARPPRGSPMVRGSIAPPRPAAPVAEAMLAQTAKMALLRSSPDGSLSFDIAFNDGVFCDMACTISLHRGVTQATFRVTDPNARRLLEAEAGRLRVGLQARGLKVDSVTVLTG